MSITPLNWITFFLFFGGNPEGQAFLIVGRGSGFPYCRYLETEDGGQVGDGGRFGRS